MQNLIVAAIVIYACWVVLKRYLPRAFKLSLIKQAASICSSVGLAQLALRLHTLHGTMPQQGGCSSCDSCDPVPSKKGANGYVQSSQLEASFSITPEDLKKTIRRP